MKKFSLFFIVLNLLISSNLITSQYYDENPDLEEVNLGYFSTLPNELNTIIIKYSGVSRFLKDASKDLRDLVLATNEIPLGISLKSPQQYEILKKFTLKIIPNLIVRYNIDLLIFDELIQSFPDLKELHLMGININNIESLRKTKNLRILVAPGYCIRDISVLGEISSLTRVNLVNQPIIRLPDLSKCLNLESINISKTRITDISPLSEARNLIEISLNHMNSKQIEGFSSLEKLDYLKFISIIGSSFKKDEILALKTLKPNLKILETLEAV